MTTPSLEPVPIASLAASDQTMKIDPWPVKLSTEIGPPSSSQNRLLLVR